jgi:demethylmenaquinone methyltransferase/2-methoxy-6-polyprenyl-1,4-benzoquinol methylase
MTTDPRDPDAARFAPHASREMAHMFDDVSGRYDLLNRVMSLGQDRAWRTELARAVPDDARVVLDLCTGSGDSLHGLRRPGRLVLGVDVSLAMLELAAARESGIGWAPRLVAADAFRLPIRDASADAVTIAFGIRNLRPRERALREIARALRPDGTLAILEATAPAAGARCAPLHRLYLERVVPLAGRLSPDPSAYRYLGRSILDFGDGSELERELADAGFSIASTRSFLAGATRLWVARRSPAGGRNVSVRPTTMQSATGLDREVGTRMAFERARDAEWRTWAAVQLAVSSALTVALAYGLWIVAKSGPVMPLTGWHRPMALWLLGGGLAVFALRTVWLALGARGPAHRR